MTKNLLFEIKQNSKLNTQPKIKHQKQKRVIKNGLNFMENKFYDSRFKAKIQITILNISNLKLVFKVIIIRLNLKSNIKLYAVYKDILT